MTPHPRYPTVFTPLRLNRLTLPNRIVVPAHTTNFGEQHLPSQRHADYHRARARGGAAAIIFEAIRVADNTLGRPQGVAGYLPGAVEAFARVADAVHEEGGLLIGQVCHLGRQIEGDFERTVSVSASSIRWAPTAYHPHPLDRQGMDEVRDAHLVVVENLLAAGLDGIELHWGHGHLLQQFLSPLSNDRGDDYGGSVENRMRFPLEVLAAVRAAVGPDVCLGVRLSAEEFVEGGIDLPMAEEIARRMVQAVPVDFIHVSHSAYHMSYSLATQMADMAMDTAPFRRLPGAIRRAVRDAGAEVPVITVCKYRDFDEAEAMLAAGEADLVGMARAHVADPAIVRKHREGREEEVRRCLGCNQGCAQRLERNIDITCMINPRVGREGRWPEAADDPAASPRRLLVVGGGPAGAEAAWVAAARGHSVALWERSDRLGGQLNQALTMPLRRDFRHLLDHQARQIERHQVAVTLGLSADADAIRAFGAEAVVLAVGSRPQPLDLPLGGDALTLDAALADPAALGDRVALADLTGDWAVLSAIEHLADLGKRVEVFTPVGAFAWRTTIYSTLANRKRLRDKGVKLRLLRGVLGFTDGRIVAEDTSTGEREELGGFDSLIGCQYNRPDGELLGNLRAGGLEVYAVGDCLSARTALEAVYEGHALARSL